MLSPFDFLILCFIFSLFSIAYWYLSVPRNLPPGPVGLPFIGNSIECFDSNKVRHLLKRYAKKYGSLYKFYIFDKLVVVLADYDTIQEALVKQSDAFAGRPRYLFGLPKFIGLDEAIDFFDSYQSPSAAMKSALLKSAAQIENEAPPEASNVVVYWDTAEVEDNICNICNLEIKGGIILSEGTVWKEARRFAFSTLRDLGLGRPLFEGRIKEETECLNKRIARYASSGEAFNPNLMITFAVANIIRQLIFGKRLSYGDDMLVQRFVALTKRVSAAGATMISPIVLSGTVSALMKLTPTYMKFKKEEMEFVELVETEMKNVIASYDPDFEPDNYIQAYMKASPHVVNEPKAYLHLTASVIDLFMGGTETTSRTLCWAILFLGHNPHVQEKMYEEIKEKVGLSCLPEYGARSKLPYTEAVITETQRLADVMPLGVARRCVTPTNLLGYEIPEDAIVVPLLNNVLHNPDLFPEPQRFDPGRFLDAGGKFARNPKMIPFEAGKRICLAESLARMELFLFLTALVSRFRFFFPEHNRSPSLEPVVGFIFSPSPYLVCVEGRDE